MKSEEWSDSGIPPIGTVCEYLWQEGMKWRKCEVVAYYFANIVAIDRVDCAAVCLHVGLFRPIKTPEQIAAEEREKAIAAEERLQAIHEMLSYVENYCTFKDLMGVLYDAGYRKTEVTK